MSKPQIKLLFVVKERAVYDTKTRAYGLYNSCRFVSKALQRNGVSSFVVQVVDGNAIDKEVAFYKPTHCFIEAIWATPAKIEELSKLHPKVEWIIRLHSMIPFLSNEGMAFEWMNDYINLRKKGVKITLSCNNEKLHSYLKPLYKYVSYTPNIYEPEDQASLLKFDFTELNAFNVGCFGALRPFKNNVHQAILAIRFADEIKKKLKFHVNVSEHEQNVAGPILKNLREVFERTNHELIEHPWYEHVDFLELVKAMDFGMQLSLTETFNITAADFVHCRIPIVASKEINFVSNATKVDVYDDEKIMKAIYNAFYRKTFVHGVMNSRHDFLEESLGLLDEHNKEAIRDWIRLLDL